MNPGRLRSTPVRVGARTIELGVPIIDDYSLDTRGPGP
jgi:hypothetical protein